MSINQKGGVVPMIGVLLLLIIVGVGAYYLGLKQNTLLPQAPVRSSSSDSPSQASPIPSPAVDNDWIEYTSKPLIGNALKPYTIKYPSDWSKQIQREEDAVDVLTLSKNNYSIKITQAGMGGGGCIFEGDMPNGPYGDYRNTPYIELESSVGTLRRIEKRANEPSMTSFEFCASSDNESYQSPTLVGAILYTVPVNYERSVLEQMDKIVETLEEAPK